MTSLQTSIRIRAEPPAVFRAYVKQIDRWWPRQGTYRYSFAPPETEPGHIRFESHQGGRFYEEFADGSEYVIGRIQVWEPPERLIYT